jgi:hypothetical protein
MADYKPDYKLVLQLLQEKGRLFHEVESLTGEIFAAPIDRINALLDTRGQVLEQIVEINERLRGFAGADAHLKSVLNCSLETDALTDETRTLFEEALRIRAAINRILKSEDNVRQRIENERSALLERIETMNSSSKTIADSYKRSVETAFPGNYDGGRDQSV